MSYPIYRADLHKDKRDYINFWKRHFPGWQEQKYDLFYENNPRGQAGCWIARDPEDDSVIGASAVFPRQMLIHGKPKLSGIAGDLAVSTVCRGHGTAKMLQKVLITEYGQLGLAFLYATANVVSERVAQAVGFRIVGRTVRMVKILRSREYIRKYLRLGFLTRAASGLVDWTLKLVSPDTRYKGSTQYTFEILREFDGRFDDLWREASPHYAIIGERTSSFLNWRFAACPYKSFSVFALTAESTGAVVAYIVYHTIHGNNIHIADLFSMRSPDVLNALLSEFIRYQRMQNADTITLCYFGDRTIVDTFKRYGFSPRADNRKIVVHIDPTLPHAAAVMDANNWHYLDGDNDADA
ncbi:MAG TPA: GNAT family N-acetyltransferase [Acidobacteriota bacterium]|nr:GNAT family N-acetyltransferase [Acidobacteriota bacterium]